MESDQFMPEYWPANRIIGKLEKALVKAENILGLIQSEQIANLAAGKVTGLLTSAQIAEIEAAKIGGQLTNAQIKEIAAAKITGQLTNAQIKEIEAAKITGLISETQIGPEAISTPLLKAGAVTAAKVAAEAITAEKIAALTITAGKIAANAITAEKINALAVTAGKIAAEAITTEKLAANSVTAAKIVAGTITAEKLSVATLSSISANIGTVTAGTIKGVKIEAGSIVGAEISLDAAASEEYKQKSETLKWVKEGTVRSEIWGGTVGFGSSKTVWRTPAEGVNAENKYIVRLENLSAPAAAECWFAAEANGQIRTIVNQKGGSTFLQLASPNFVGNNYNEAPKKEVYITSINLTINNGATESAGLKVTHNMASTAGHTSGQTGAAGFAIPISCKMIESTASTATFRAIASSAMPGTTPITFTFLIAIYSN